jgi:tRNA G37 N-methylase Trm5
MKLKAALGEVLDENALAKLIKLYDVIGDIIIIRIPLA